MKEPARRQEAVVIPIQPVELMVALAKRGLRQPATLSTTEIEAVCRTLLCQYAQMGIG